MPQMLKVLGIESSCDETAAAVVADGSKILSDVVASQVELHSRYGGVVPEVASRQHLLAAIPIIEQAMAQAQVAWTDLSAVAVTIGPGLVGSLLVGVNMAKGIALARGLPLIGINHLEAHIYANWLEGKEPPFPLLCLIVSGGHTDLILMQGHGVYLRLGNSRDDAAGEAFDKVARILGLGYPGGPAIERASQEGTARYHLPRAWLKGSDDFSFSGLKTAVFRLTEELRSSGQINSTVLADIAASFQQAVVDVLVTKTVEAARRHQVQCILLAGGVAANKLLRETMALRSPTPVFCPRPALCTDNAAMVAASGYFHLISGQSDPWDLDVRPNLRLG
jgi:N6-L-threonylcarbamoyladenine synthase